MSLDTIIVRLLTQTVKNNFYFIEEISSLNNKIKSNPYNTSFLQNVINQKNSLSVGMLVTKNNISTLNSTSNNINQVLNGLRTTVNTIKSIPIPVSTPPGMGIPISILTTYSDFLDKLRELIKENHELSKLIPTITDTFNALIGDMEREIVSLDTSLSEIIEDETLLRVKSKYGENYTILELDEIRDEILEELNFSKYEFTSPNEEPNSDRVLLERLKPNSQTPIVYSGFKLEIQYNPSNSFSFPSRRIKGTNIETNQILYNDEGKYSYSNSLNVLLEEIKFVIKNNKSNIYKHEKIRVNNIN